MEAILKFNLPEETEEHQIALDGWKYKSVTEDLFNFLRRSEKNDKYELTTQEVREKLVELLSDVGVT